MLSGSDILGEIDAFNAAGDAEDEADLQLLDSIISGNVSVKGDSLKLDGLRSGLGTFHSTARIFPSPSIWVPIPP